MACRVPEPDALDIIRREVDDIVAVTDDEVAGRDARAVRRHPQRRRGRWATRSPPRLQQRAHCAGRSIGLVIGANVDSAVFAQVLIRGRVGAA